jgi:hypothetical protein
MFPCGLLDTLIGFSPEKDPLRFFVVFLFLSRHLLV